MACRSSKYVFIAAIAAVAIIAALGASRAEANTIGISTPAALTDGGHVDWSTYALEFDPVLNGTTKAVPGIAGLNLTVLEQTGFDFLRVAEGTTWLGNFANGDPLLYSTGGGAIDYVFSSPIGAFGSRIQSATYGAFTARLDAFDAANNLLGSYVASGNSTGAEDGSAIFLGLSSDVSNISRVRLSLSAAQPDGFGSVNLGDFAVNDPSISAAPVPEPASIVLFGLGLAGVAAAQRIVRRSRKGEDAVR